MENKTVIVIGAANMDICGRPNAAPRLHDSNPGRLTLNPGGVGRNIAHNLRLLGLNVKLIIALGDDVYGDSLYRSCTELGMDMSLCRRIEDARTSTYLYVTDEKGEMLIGIADMDISDYITPEYLEGHLDEINAADAVLMDCNLSERTIAWIVENVTAPLYADPVSTAKGARIRPVLGKLTSFKPNLLEAMSMTGKDNARDAVKEFIALGVKRIFVTRGADGIIAAEGDEVVELPHEMVEVVNTTGCGDSATAAIIWAGVHGLDLYSTAKASMKAAAVTIQSTKTVNPELCEEKIK